MNNDSFIITLKKHPAILIILIIGILIRLGFDFLLPFGQSVRFHFEGLNDEPSHLNYVKYLAINKKFPVQTESSQTQDAFKHNVFEYYQPPLYYMLCASLHPWLKDNGTLYFGRILSFLAGLLSLLVLYRILTYLNMPVQLKTAASVFYLLQLSNSYFCSLLSNDSLSWLFALLITMYLLIVFSKTESVEFRNRWKQSLGLSFLLGIGMLVKSSIFIFFPIVVCIFGVLYLKQKKNFLILECALILMIASIVAIPWYYRNLCIYKSLFALHIGFGPASETVKSLLEWRYVLSSTVLRFWFPMQHIERTIYFKAFSAIAAGIVFLHTLAFCFIHKKKINKNFWVLFLILVLSTIAYLKLQLSWNNPEGRYLFSAWAPIIYFWFGLIKLPLNNGLLIAITLIESSVGYIFFVFT